MINTEQAERDLIATVLVTKNEVEKVMAIDAVSLDMIHGVNNKPVWEAIKQLSDDGHIVDLSAVFGKLPTEIAYVSEITQNSGAISSYLNGYVTRVKKGAYLYEARKRTMAALDVIDNLTDLTTIETVPNAIEGVFEGLMLDDSNNKPLHFKEVAKDYVEELRAKSQGELDQHIVNTGIHELDSQTGGFNNTDLIVLAGLSGSGKTEMAIKIKTAIANAGMGTLIFSLEMSNKQVVERAIGATAQLPISVLRNPQNLADTPNGWDKTGAAVAGLIQKDMYLYDQTGLTVRQIITIAKAHKARHPDLKLIVVDHVGLMELEGNGQHHHQVGDISKKLKQLAKDIKTPVMMLSQVVGKQIMQRPVKDRTPNAQDVKDSSRIEEDADLILFTHRQETHDEISPKFAELVFGKARHAIKGTRVYFNFVNGHFSPTDQGHARNVMKGYYETSSKKTGGAITRDGS